MASKSRSKVTFQDVHFTRGFKNRLISSFSEQVSQVVICSPYFGLLPEPFKTVEGFCLFLNRRGVENIQIITRPPSADAEALPIEMARSLSGWGVEIFVKTTPYLHAKMYHIEYAKGYFRSFVGSANFTKGGLERNHELVTEMEGVGSDSPCHRELARLVCNRGTLTFEMWLRENQPQDAGEAK